MIPTTRILVIGAGQMGSGIAQVAATSGYAVTLLDVDAGRVARGLEGIRASVNKLLGKGRLTTEQAAGVAHIVASTDLDAAAEAEVVIEAASEDVDLKRRLFADLDRLAPDTAVLTSNTSSISITRLAAATRRPEQVAGMHFFNPVPIMRPVEVVRGERTAEATITRVVQLAEALGKTAVVVKDAPGFVSNRLLCPMLNEAINALDQGVATRDGIDAIMQLGMNHPMGPLALADLIGLDTVLAILEVLHRDFGDDRFAPAPLLRRMVDAGLLGRKSGQGFYVYD